MPNNREGWTYALAILILVSKVKKALANCSPSTSYQYSSSHLYLELTSKGRLDNLIISTSITETS
jgi:hypothetical protein